MTAAAQVRICTYRALASACMVAADLAAIVINHYHAASFTNACHSRFSAKVCFMDALTLLHTRNSAAKLVAPAPSGEALENLFKAALRAPDHARLRPMRFLTVEGEARNRLGELFVSAAQVRLANAGQPPMSQEACDKQAAKTLRAPLIIVVIASLQEHPKVPAIEQRLTAGCAAHAMLLAAHAQGFAGIWRTGGNAYDAEIKRGLGLIPYEEIVGYLYLGTVEGAYKPLRDPDIHEFYQPWTGEL